MTTKPKKKIRIMLVEDHILIRMGLVTASQLEPDIELVAEVEEGEEAVEAYRTHRPDLNRRTGILPVSILFACGAEKVRDRQDACPTYS